MEAALFKVAPLIWMFVRQEHHIIKITGFITKLTLKPYP